MTIFAGPFFRDNFPKLSINIFQERRFLISYFGSFMGKAVKTVRASFEICRRELSFSFIPPQSLSRPFPVPIRHGTSVEEKTMQAQVLFTCIFVALDEATIIDTIVPPAVILQTYGACNLMIMVFLVAIPTSTPNTKHIYEHESDQHEEVGDLGRMRKDNIKHGIASWLA